MSQLAILGGTPVLPGPLRKYRSMGEAEKRAVMEVIDSDRLSGFYGSPGPEFYGGERVRAFEAAWRERYGVAHAISVNSNTSGLVAAMGAIGVSPGDEVIVPPWTMSATVMAPLAYGGIPVFADIEPETYCLDVEQVNAAITPRTRAILAVNLFGHPARLLDLRQLADKHGLHLVEDNAQAPWSWEQGRRAGTIGHIGVFSLNYHKHIHTGEGGMCVTDDARLAERIACIRNHAENMMRDRPRDDLVNMVGYNLRMTELCAAIGIEQLKRVEESVARRERLAEALSEGTRDLPGWHVPSAREGCRHNYYVWATRFDADAVGVSRDLFGRALAAEGFPHAVGYVRPQYMLPAFQQRLALGRDGFPFTLTNRVYAEGMCPVVEAMHKRHAVLFEPCAYDVDDREAGLLVEAVRKVYAHRADLAAMDGGATAQA